MGMEKTKKIEVTPELHGRIKVFCSVRGLKIKAWVDKVLKAALPKDKGV